MLTAIVLFFAAVMAHIFYCRKSPLAGLHAKAFGIIAIIFLGVYIGIILMVDHSQILGSQGLWVLPFRITAGVIYILLVPVYLIFYTLTQQTSPSKKILLSISEQGEMTLSDIMAVAEEQDFIAIRLEDLCLSGCVKVVEGRYILSASGQKIATVLNIMEHLLGRGIGG